MFLGESNIDWNDKKYGFDLVEQLLKVFRQLVEAADPVGGHGHVDLLRVGQVQVVHDLKELEPGNFRRDLSRFLSNI